MDSDLDGSSEWERRFQRRDDSESWIDSLMPNNHFMVESALKRLIKNRDKFLDEEIEKNKIFDFLESNRLATEILRKRAEKEKILNDKKKAEEEEIARKIAKEEEIARKKTEEEEIARKIAEEEEIARKKTEEEELERKRIEEETAKRKADEEAIRKKEEDETARKKVEEEEKKKLAAALVKEEARKKEEEIARRNAEILAQEEIARRKAFHTRLMVRLKHHFQYARLRLILNNWKSAALKKRLYRNQDEKKQKITSLLNNLKQAASKPSNSLKQAASKPSTPKRQPDVPKNSIKRPPPKSFAMSAKVTSSKIATKSSTSKSSVSSNPNPPSTLSKQIRPNPKHSISSNQSKSIPKTVSIKPVKPRQSAIVRNREILKMPKKLDNEQEKQRKAIQDLQVKKLLLAKEQERRELEFKNRLAEMHFERASIIFRGWRPWNQLLERQRALRALADRSFMYRFFSSWKIIAETIHEKRLRGMGRFVIKLDQCLSRYRYRVAFFEFRRYIRAQKQLEYEGFRQYCRFTMAPIFSCLKQRYASRCTMRDIRQQQLDLEAIRNHDILLKLRGFLHFKSLIVSKRVRNNIDSEKNQLKSRAMQLLLEHRKKR